MFNRSVSCLLNLSGYSIIKVKRHKNYSYGFREPVFMPILKNISVSYIN